MTIQPLYSVVSNGKTRKEKKEEICNIQTQKAKRCIKVFSYSLYGNEDKENISSYENTEFYFAPRVILQIFYSQMELSLACCAVRESKTFL